MKKRAVFWLTVVMTMAGLVILGVVATTDDVSIWDILITIGGAILIGGLFAGPLGIGIHIFGYSIILMIGLTYFPSDIWFSMAMFSVAFIAVGKFFKRWRTNKKELLHQEAIVIKRTIKSETEIDTDSTSIDPSLDDKVKELEEYLVRNLLLFNYDGGQEFNKISFNIFHPVEVGTDQDRLEAELKYDEEIQNDIEKKGKASLEAFVKDVSRDIPELEVYDDEEVETDGG